MLGESSNSESGEERLSLLSWLMIGGTLGQAPPTWNRLLKMAQARNRAIAKSAVPESPNDDDDDAQDAAEKEASAEDQSDGASETKAGGDATFQRPPEPATPDAPETARSQSNKQSEHSEA